MILDSQALLPTIPMPRCPFWNVYCVIVSNLTIWQWTKKWWRGFLGAAASIWAVRLFQVKWKDDSDDFGRDLMRGTIGEQVVTELWPLWMEFLFGEAGTWLLLTDMSTSQKIYLDFTLCWRGLYISIYIIYSDGQFCPYSVLLHCV